MLYNKTNNICGLYCRPLLYTDSRATFHLRKTRVFPLSTYPLQFQYHCDYGQYKYVLKHLLTPWSRVLEKPISTQQVMKFPAFMEAEGSLPCSQEPVTCLCPETDQSSLWPPSHFLRIHLNIILPSMPGSTKWFFLSGFHYQNHVSNSPLPHTCYTPRSSHSSKFDHPNNIYYEEICT